MQEKTKSDSDRELIKDLFGAGPIDWARYPDGKLVFISMTGQKFSYSQEQLDNISEAVKIERAAAKRLSRKKSEPKSKTETKNSEKDSAGAAE